MPSQGSQPHLSVPRGSDTHGGRNRSVVAESQLQSPLHLLDTVEILRRGDSQRNKSQVSPLTPSAHLHDNQLNVVLNEDLEPLSQLPLDLLPALPFLVGPGLDNPPSQDCSPPPADPLGDVAAGLVDLPTLGRTI